MESERSSMHYHDSISSLQRGETMRNHQNSFVNEVTTNIGNHLPLGIGIQGRRSLIEDNQTRRRKKHPSESDCCLCPLKPRAPLANSGVVTLLKTHDEIMSTSKLETSAHPHWKRQDYP